MRGLKIAIAIGAKIEGILAIIGGIGLMLMSFEDFMAEFLPEELVSSPLAELMENMFSAIIITSGVFSILFGIAWIGLGTWFMMSRRPLKPLAIVFLVFCCIGALGIFMLEWTALICIAMIILIIAYLAKVGEQKQQCPQMPPPQQSMQNFDNNML